MFFRSFGDWFFLLSSLQGRKHYTASLFFVSLLILAPGSVRTHWRFVECGGLHHCALVILTTFRECTVLVH